MEIMERYLAVFAVGEWWGCYPYSVVKIEVEKEWGYGAFSLAGWNKNQISMRGSHKHGVPDHSYHKTYSEAKKALLKYLDEHADQKIQESDLLREEAKALNSRAEELREQTSC